MLFTSYEFILFLLIVFILYYVVPKKLQWPLLLLASYVFYFFSGAQNLCYIVFTTISTYLITGQIQKSIDIQSDYLREHKKEMSRAERKAYKEAGKKKQWRLLLLCLILNIGMLAVVKYTNFVIYNINGILTMAKSDMQISFWNIALPMGISFYVFQTMGYAIDVYRGKYRAESNPFRLALFVSFFPQLIQGPISRFDDLAKSLFEPHSFDKRTVAFGLQRILWGFFKKLVIADRIVVAVNEIIGDTGTYSGAWVFVGMMFYALELYADFTGGIDITIGIAQTMGIKVTENFIRPYFSKNIKEYWNRWHITMGSWFTDYIFYPISVCQPMLKLSRFSRTHFGEQAGKRVTVYLSCFVVWFATGIWHGASWNFIVWGLGNCVVILVSQELEPFYRWFHGKVHVSGTFGWRMFQVIRTVLLMSCLRTFDCYRDVPLTFRMFGSIFTTWNWRELFSGALLELGLGISDYIVVLIGFFLLLGVSLAQRSGAVREKIAAKCYCVRFVIWFGLFLLILLWGTYGIGYDASQFIYNQF